MNILIAEDDVTSRAMLAAVLKKWGVDPVVTEDGEAAWQAMQTPDAPQLVIVDWNMPKMDGMEFCRRVRQEQTSNPPYIVLLTSRGEMRDIVQGLDAGASDYITKPYHVEELQARLRVGRRMLDLQAELNKARNLFEHQALHDELTGVLNRRAIVEVLNKEVRRTDRSEKGLSIGLLDIDHFKAINDTFGHQAGDEVLVGFTRRLQQNLREYDHVGRYGGEEFLIVAPEDGGGPETGLYERLRAAVAQEPIPTSAGAISVTVSIGVAAAGGTQTLESVLAAADAAMYEAKCAGRNRVAYSSSLTAIIR
ncbi:MAG TPA: diguanylate cyclase, partial [Rhizobiaceae bacterium]|nr:diguanylate cyclase [Rhizobiaceae bacterium]